MAKFNPDDCKFCNNTNGICCHEVIMTDEKTPRQIIDLINVNRNQFIVTTTFFTLVSNSFNRDSATAIFKNFNMCAWLEGIFHD